MRTPDPVPGWLTEEELAAARRKLPMVYVQAIPVILDPLGNVVEVGLLLRPNEDGEMVRSFVSGRVHYRETIRAALLRHLEKDLGPLAMPQLPASLTPFTVAEYFPTPGEGWYDERQHAISLAYVVPIDGETAPQEDALELSWFGVDELLGDSSPLHEMDGGRDLLVRVLGHDERPVGELEAGQGDVAVVVEQEVEVLGRGDEGGLAVGVGLGDSVDRELLARHRQGLDDLVDGVVHEVGGEPLGQRV